MLPPLVQRNASVFAAPEKKEAAELLVPTTIEPSAETPFALLSKFPPGKSPRPTIAALLVQRKASDPEADVPSPTTTEPSAETPLAVLLKLPPAKSPRPTKPVPLVQRNASPPE